MEDTFRVRVDKVFGALGGDTEASVGVSPALWCLTDEEIERREWNRCKDIPEEGEDGVGSRPSVMPSDLESDLKELSDCEEEEENTFSSTIPKSFLKTLNPPGVEEEEEEEEEESEEIDGAKKRHRSNSGGSGDDSSVVEYLDVQSNIGRDCTLDYEEEEDEYDKVAVGSEQTGDRVYMRDVKCADYEIDEVSGYPELPSSFQISAKDPRANHSAAIVRLREDAEAAGEFGAFKLSDNIQKGEVDVDNPKPILKKKENLMDTKSLKRVRFMVDESSSQQTSGASDLTSMDDNAVKEEAASDLSVYSPGVPDYIRNPSKYTHYTFDSSDDIDEELNRKAYADLFNDLRKRNSDTLMEERPVEMPKSVVFTPKKKPENDSTVSKLKTRENVEKKRWSVEITAEESDISAMEEDVPAPTITSQKSGRRYRTKTNLDHIDN